MSPLQQSSHYSTELSRPPSSAPSTSQERVGVSKGGQVIVLPTSSKPPHPDPGSMEQLHLPDAGHTPPPAPAPGTPPPQQQPSGHLERGHQVTLRQHNSSRKKETTDCHFILTFSVPWASGLPSAEGSWETRGHFGPMPRERLQGRAIPGTGKTSVRLPESLESTPNSFWSPSRSTWGASLSGVGRKHQPVQSAPGTDSSALCSLMASQRP